MAYPDHIGIFTDQNYYRGPGSELAYAKAEAAKKASYLSSMDQYYAQLTETQRQFDVNSEFQERSLDIQESKVDIMQDQLDMQEMLGLKELDLKQSMFEDELGFTQQMYSNYMDAREKDSSSASSAQSIQNLFDSVYNPAGGEVATSAAENQPDIPLMPGLGPDVKDFLGITE